MGGRDSNPLSDTSWSRSGDDGIAQEATVKILTLALHANEAGSAHISRHREADM